MPTESVATPGSRTATATQTADGAGNVAVAPDDSRLGSWRSFLHAHAHLTRRLDEELQAVHQLSLAEYDALLQLARTPGRRLRMSALAERVLLSRSGITRLVDRLEAAGMVQRSACATDARGAEAILTPAGLNRLRRASATHLAGIERYFLDVVSLAEQASIEAGLNRVIDGLGCNSSADPAFARDAGGAGVGDA
jgi:DNA-binding MarR family transcriptional regulator